MYIKENLFQSHTNLQDGLEKLQTRLKESCLKREALQIKVNELSNRLFADQLVLNEYEELYTKLAQSLHLDDAENYMMYRAAHQQLEKETIKCKGKIEKLINKSAFLINEEGILKRNALMIKKGIDRIREISAKERKERLLVELKK